MSQDKKKHTKEYNRMLKEFKGDYRIVRVVVASASPMDTLHKIRTGQYSVATFLDMLEMLDVKATIEEDEIEMSRKNNA